MTATVWQPGMRITADRLNDASPLNWASWTPAWSTTTGANKSSYGNATVDCRYVEFGLMVQYSMNITFGSTTSFSAQADNWTFGLPITAALSDAPIGYVSMYMGDLSNASAGMAALYDTTRFMIYTASGNVDNTTMAAGIADAQSPFPWVSGNRLTVFGQYQAAA